MLSDLWSPASACVPVRPVPCLFVASPCLGCIVAEEFPPLGHAWTPPPSGRPSVRSAPALSVSVRPPVSDAALPFRTARCAGPATPTHHFSILHITRV